SGNLSPTDFVIRIWGPDKKEIGAVTQPAPGTGLTYVAATDDTYTIGISTSKNAAYQFQPDEDQTRPKDSSASLHVYTAAFDVFPGSKTNLMGILKDYRGDWPDWKGNERTAYNTLTAIATAASNKEGTGIIDFSGSFEQVGTAT